MNLDTAKPLSRIFQEIRPHGLALQLHSSFLMYLLRGGLVSPPPQRPCNDQRRFNALLRQTHGDAAYLLH
jgi:hypothetical protein